MKPQIRKGAELWPVKLFCPKMKPQLQKGAELWPVQLFVKKNRNRSNPIASPFETVRLIVRFQAIIAWKLRFQGQEEDVVDNLMFFLQMCIKFSEVMCCKITEVTVICREAGMQVFDVNNHTFWISRFKTTPFASVEARNNW